MSRRRRISASLIALASRLGSTREDSALRAGLLLAPRSLTLRRVQS